MILTNDQLAAIGKGMPIRLNEGGIDIVVVRADLISLPSLTDVPNAGWHKWFSRIEACRALKDGWNGYTAAAPNETAITNALLFLQEMQLANAEPTRVGPSAMGGIAITRRSGARKVFVEFYNDGRVYSLFSEKSGEMEVHPLEANSLSFRALVANLRDYLDAEIAA